MVLGFDEFFSKIKKYLPAEKAKEAIDFAADFYIGKGNSEFMYLSDAYDFISKRLYEKKRE